jgi:hypothetical protein
VTGFDHSPHPVLVVPHQIRIEPGVEPEVLHERDVADLPQVQEPVGVERGLEIPGRLPELIDLEFPVPLGPRACRRASRRPNRRVPQRAGYALANVLYRI